jgi:ectoine hydroxylase-related dioxygenase (phytanoyl-CoA dioxygenase family)
VPNNTVFHQPEVENLQKNGVIDFQVGPLDYTYPKHSTRPTKPFKVKAKIAIPALAYDLMPIVAEYYGKKPGQPEAELIHTYPTKEKACGSQLWHRDHHGPKFIRVLVYLVDVDLNNGPFCYQLGSHKHPNGPEHTFIGPKGTAIMFDTLGLHRGLKNLTGDRLALSISYPHG